MNDKERIALLTEIIKDKDAVLKKVEQFILIKTCRECIYWEENASGECVDGVLFGWCTLRNKFEKANFGCIGFKEKEDK